MKRMKAGLMAMLAAGGFSISAQAQEPVDPLFLTVVEELVLGCMDASDAKLPPAEVAEECLWGMEDIKEFVLYEDMSLQDGYSWNHVHFALAFLRHSVADAYTAEDGALSERACQEVERAWTEASQINPATLLPEMADVMLETQGLVRDSATNCRQYYAAPDWALPLGQD